jgi:hypothetical protein
VGGSAASNVTRLSGGLLTFDTPAGTAGSASVSVTNPGASPVVTTATGAFTYGAPTPVVISVTPSVASNAGGRTVTITGSGFQRTGASVPGVVIGATCTNVQVLTATTLICVTGSSTLTGSQNVVVTNPNTNTGSLVAGFTLFASGSLVNGFGTSGVVTTNPNTGWAGAWAIVGDGTNIYVGGWEETTTSNDYLWRTEKRSRATGALVNGFGTSGVVTLDPSTGPEWVEHVAHDGTHLYLVGPDTQPGNNQWRIEKRLLSSGALISGFGTSGVVLSNPTGNNDTPTWVVLDSTHLYVAGWDRNGTSDGWRVEKRLLSTGALASGFGASGVVRSNPNAGLDRAHTMVLVGGDLYIAGIDDNAGDRAWRIERRASSNGALVTGFGTGGAIVSNPSTGIDAAWGASTDGTNLYVVGWDASGGNDRWRVEKRTLTTGALVTGFGTGGVVATNPSSGSDLAWGVINDATSLYVFGEDRVPGGVDSRWRIEKRSLATGALVTGFGSSGVVAIKPSTGLDHAFRGFLDETGLYIVGEDFAPGDFQFRMEKRWK